MVAKKKNSTKIKKIMGQLTSVFIMCCQNDLQELRKKPKMEKVSRMDKKSKMKPVNLCHCTILIYNNWTVKLGFNSSIALTSPVFSAPFEGVLAGSVLQEVSGIDFCTAQRDQWGMAWTMHLYFQGGCHPWKEAHHMWKHAWHSIKGQMGVLNLDSN